MLSLDDRKRCCQPGLEKVVHEKRTRLEGVEVGGVNQVEVFLWLDVLTSCTAELTFISTVGN